MFLVVLSKLNCHEIGDDMNNSIFHGWFFSLALGRALAACLIANLSLTAGCALKHQSHFPLVSPTDLSDSPNFYVFGWQDFPNDSLPIRGGMTIGVPVILDTSISQAWVNLQQLGLSEMERDQSAIRGLAGDFKASFDFLETLVFVPKGAPAQPYRSWGTERVFLIEDQPGFVELQHILVMYFFDDKGNISEPFVMKHWRQRWEFEPDRIHSYKGDGVWENRRLPSGTAKGKWTQTVYQVDDTPRYALIGEWQHHRTHSQWSSSPGYRPLPSRERSVRDDYDVLDGINRITVFPSGWVHEQDNLKRVLSTGSDLSDGTFVIARELGLNRYQRIANFDFSAGDEYWDKTGPFWAAVRHSIDYRIQKSTKIRIENSCNGSSPYELFFSQASNYEANEWNDLRVVEDGIQELLDCIITELD
tara:strand:- start:253 stop:1506 length:1254 start_codon:yes stop_codon:yes gene_type:complete